MCVCVCVSVSVCVRIRVSVCVCVWGGGGGNILLQVVFNIVQFNFSLRIHFLSLINKVFKLTQTKCTVTISISFFEKSLSICYHQFLLYCGAVTDGKDTLGTLHTEVFVCEQGTSGQRERRLLKFCDMRLNSVKLQSIFATKNYACVP